MQTGNLLPGRHNLPSVLQIIIAIEQIGNLLPAAGGPQHVTTYQVVLQIIVAVEQIGNLIPTAGGSQHAMLRYTLRYKLSRSDIR